MKIIKSASTSRVYERLRNNDIQVAIISPYRGEYNNKENKERMTHLKADVRKLGYGFNQLVSRWVENGESFDEESLLIPDITFKQAFQLGKKYDQSSILYKDSGTIREICTTPFESYSVGDVVRTFVNNGDFLNMKEAEEIFSRRRGGPASLLKKGGNKKPFKLGEKPVKSSFELLEVINPRPSYFQTDCSYRTILSVNKV